MVFRKANSAGRGLWGGLAESEFGGAAGKVNGRLNPAIGFR
jgi:hypothetical protein